MENSSTDPATQTRNAGCRTASDFEALIDSLEKPVDVRSNFSGIITSIAARQSLAGRPSDWWDVRGMGRPDRQGFWGVIVGRQGKRLTNR